MTEIDASEALLRFDELLDEVERGAVYVITRNGRAIARMDSEGSQRPPDVDQELRD